MHVFLNERCIYESPHIDDLLPDLAQQLQELYDKDIKVFTQVQTLVLWKKGVEDVLDKPARHFLNKLFQFVEELPGNQPPFYYHLFTHQNFTLNVSINLYPSSIADATDIYLKKQTVCLLTLPGTSYSRRPFLPVLRSPFASHHSDQLATIPCFLQAIEVYRYKLLYEEVKPMLKPEEFETFAQEFLQTTATFNFAAWEPNTTQAKRLIAEKAFPLSQSPLLTKIISGWQIKKGSTGANASAYRQRGHLVLSLNGYVHNPVLSRKYGYEIYEGGRGNRKLLISLDVENGGLETIDSKGDHIGVYGYTGEFIKNYFDDPKALGDHSLANLPSSLFLIK